MKELHAANRRSHVAFRPLIAAEEPAGYQIICDTVDWLREKGIKLWAKPLPREVYAARHQRGENFGLFVDGELAVIVSLVNGVPEYWAAEAKGKQPVWLCTLATATKFRGRGLGRAAVRQALQIWRGRAVYLDCKPGWLVELYASLGFGAVQQKTLTLDHGPCGPIDAVLMHWLDGPASCGNSPASVAVCGAVAMIEVRPMTLADHAAILEVAKALPEWFTPKGRAMIAQDIEWQAGFVTCAGPDVTGFVTYHVKEGRGHIGWIGVRPDRQRRGEGRRLIEQVVAALRAAGIRELEVHTLGEAVDYPPYAATRQFYRALGFDVARRIAHPEHSECEEELVLVKQLL